MFQGRRRVRIRTIVFYAVLGVFAVIWLLPVIFVIFTALKNPAQLATSGGMFSFPHPLDWQNLADAWSIGNIGLYMRNSVVITTIKVPAGIVVESLAAFAFARMRFRFSTPVFIFILVGMVLPVQAALIPLNSLLTQFNLLNNFASLIVIYIGFGVPFGVLVLRGYFRTIPLELDEAALMDGCSYLGLYWRIIMPLAIPAIAALIIFDSLFTWNEFLLAQLFLTDGAMRTVSAGLLAFTSQYTTNYTLLNAGIVLTMLPVIGVYLVFQRYFVSGLAGAIKG
ncbi:MAG TPA: carbohydrate ABC transporter permease [Chloroflexota bacterium]|nr:carbohydrate ABC transporter permease [Chloroflexota bacterium]